MQEVGISFGQKKWEESRAGFLPYSSIHFSEMPCASLNRVAGGIRRASGGLPNRAALVREERSLAGGTHRYRSGGK
jgi:hypothetical protein